MTKCDLVTRIPGQDAPHLAELPMLKGIRVCGLMRGQNSSKLAILHEVLPEVRVLTGDLTDLSSVMRALEASEPVEDYNLGAISFVA